MDDTIDVNTIHSNSLVLSLAVPMRWSVLCRLRLSRLASDLSRPDPTLLSFRISFLTISKHTNKHTSAHVYP